MININLLPWRKAIKNRNKYLLISRSIAMAVITIIICTLVYFWAAHRAASVGPERLLLNKEIKETDAKINALSKYKKINDDLKKQIILLSALQQKKYQILSILFDLNSALPKSIYLDRIVQKSNEITIYGNANTNQQISELINRLRESNLIMNPLLREAKTLNQDDSIYIKFEITAEIENKDNLNQETKNAQPGKAKTKK